ncbi:MAG: peptidylprolyl isomerase [Candidatus Ornithospirochaeta sp.]
MKKTFAIISILLIVTLSLSAATISSPAATVNLTKNKVITMDTLNKEVEFYTNNGVSVQQLDVLNSLIDEILIEQGAARDGYSVSDSEVEQLYASQKASVESQAGATLTDAEFAALVAESYGSVEEYKSYLKLQYLTQIYVSGAKADVLNNVAEPTDKEIKTWYRQNSSNFTLPERVRLSLIAMEKTGDSATDSKKLATLQACYNDIKSGKITFEKGVQLYSEDTSSLSIGGDWGFMADTTSTRTNMGDDFVETVMLMDAGDIEGVFETPYIYAIVKCTVHSDPTVLGLNDTIEEYGITVNEYIRQGLLYQNSQYAFINAYNELIADLRSQAKINIILK